jgi:hypothetical protein
MVKLEHAVERFGGALQLLSNREVRELNRSLRTLTLAQHAFIRETLAGTHKSRELSANEWRMLAHSLEHWSAHDLGMKLALIVCVERAAGTGSWPDDVRNKYPALNAIIH